MEEPYTEGVAIHGDPELRIPSHSVHPFRSKGLAR